MYSSLVRKHSACGGGLPWAGLPWRQDRQFLHALETGIWGQGLLRIWHGPRPHRPVIRLEGGDVVAEAVGECDVVPAVEQPCAPHRVDRERIGAVAAHDSLLLEIDRERKLRV